MYLNNKRGGSSAATSFEEILSEFYSIANTLNLIYVVFLGFVPTNMCKPFLLTISRRYFFCGSLLSFVFHVCHAVLPVSCGPVVNC